MIFVECYADEYFLKIIGFLKKQIIHPRFACKGKVIQNVQKIPKSIGIIDEDPEQKPPSRLKNYIKKEVSKDKTLILLINNNEQKFLIQISPYLEAWLINRAKKHKISPTKFNLPDNPKVMHDIVHIEKNKNFQDFLNQLIQANDEEINILKKWIKEILS